MDNLENIFSIDTSSWLPLGASSSTCCNDLLIQQQMNYYNNYNDTFDIQNHMASSSSYSSPLSDIELDLPPFPVKKNNNNTNHNSIDIMAESIENNSQIKEQILLIQQQKQKQQYQLQIQLQNYQQQQTRAFEQRQQQYLQQFNQLQPPTFINNTVANMAVPQQNINPIVDKTVVASMKTTFTDSLSTNYNSSINVVPTTTTSSISNNNKMQPNTNSNGKKKKFDNSEYHKKHREKKKDQVKEIENQIKALTLENQQLIKENEYIKEKGEGVDNLRPDRETISLYKETIAITTQMKEALENNDERSLIYLLHLYHLSFKRVFTICERDVASAFHPNIQLIFATMSYVPSNEQHIYDILSGSQSDKWLNQYKEEAELTIEQSNKLDSLRNKFSILDEQFLKERLELDKEVKKFYFNRILMLPNNPLLTAGVDYQPYISDLSQTPLLNSKPLDIIESLEFINKLASLKNKVFIGRVLLMDVYSSLGSFLTPRQEAIFFVRINQCMSFDDTRFDILNEVWSNILFSKSLSGAIGIADALKKYLNENNFSGDPSNNTVTPFSLKPATFNPL